MVKNHTIRPTNKAMSVYEVVITGNVPPELAGTYRCTATSPEEAKNKLVISINTGRRGLIRRNLRKPKKLKTYMKAKKIK